MRSAATTRIRRFVVVGLTGFAFSMTPSANAAAVPSFSDPEVFLKRLDSGFDVAVQDGTVYFTERGARTVNAIGLSDRIDKVLVSGVQSPEGLDVTANGDVYYLNTGTNPHEMNVLRRGAPNPDTVLTGMNNAISLDVAPNGDIYYAEHANPGRLMVLRKDSTTPETLLTGLTRPGFVALNREGDLYFLEGLDNQPGKLSVLKNGSSTPTPLLDNIGTCYGLDVDADDNVFFACYSTGKLYMLPAGATTPTILMDDLDIPTGVAVDASGNVYVTENRGGHIYVLHRNAPNGGDGEPNPGGAIFGS